MHRTVPLLIGLLAVSGCFSSSESSSKSSSSPFEWSSASSASSSSSKSSSHGRESYRDDVRDYTAAYVQSGGDYAAFTRGLSNVASKHGVSDWESDMDTYEGVGAGLKKANQTPAQLSVWQQNLAAGDSQKSSAIQDGYDSYKPR